MIKRWWFHTFNIQTHEALFTGEDLLHIQYYMACVYTTVNHHIKKPIARAPRARLFKKKSSTGGVGTTRQTFHAVYDKMTTFLYKNMILNNVLNNGSQSVRHSRALRVKKREDWTILAATFPTFLSFSRIFTDFSFRFLHTFQLSFISLDNFVTPFAFHYSVLVD